MKTNQMSQYQKILYRMAKRPNKEWWLPQDFITDDNGFVYVGYEASARLSELAKRYPEMIASQPQGKYLARKIQFDDLVNWLHILPKEYRQVFHITGHTKELRLNPDEPKPLPPVLEPPIKQPTRKSAYRARYIGRTYSAEGYQYGKDYDIEINRLVVGKPIKLLSPIPRSYSNPTAFNQDWRIFE